MIMNYLIINLQWPKDTSFSWTNGLYVVTKVKDDTYHMCKLNDNWTLSKYPDNTLSISCIGIDNKYVTKTKLRYQTTNMLI